MMYRSDETRKGKETIRYVVKTARFVTIWGSVPFHCVSSTRTSVRRMSDGIWWI